MLTRLNRTYLVLVQLRSAARQITERRYSTNKTTSKDEIECDEAPPKLSYPFYGREETPGKGDEADKCVGKTYSADNSYYIFAGGRRDGGGKYRLPGVTTVLVSTKAKSSHFALSYWKNKLIEKHGQKGFEMIKKETISRGTAFHEVH